MMENAPPCHKIRISWIPSNFLTYTWGSWGPERERNLPKVTQLMRGSQNYKQDFQTQVQGHIPPGHILIDGNCGTGKWPSALKQVLLLGNAQENGVGNTQVYTLAFIWVRDVYLPLILSAVLLQRPCPSALQTHPKACPAHWIIQCLLAMLPWGAPDVHAIGIIAAGLTQKGRKFQTQLKAKEKGYSMAILHAAAAKSLQSCPILCDPIDGSPSGSTVPGILQARTLEWVAIFFSNAWKWKLKVKSLSRVRLLATPWTAAYQAPLSVGFSRQEYWSGVSSPSPKE